MNILGNVDGNCGKRTRYLKIGLESLYLFFINLDISLGKNLTIEKLSLSIF